MHVDRTEAFRIAPERLWPLVANTDSLNREIKLPEVSYELSPAPQGGTTVRAKARTAGMKLEWEEHPYEWTWPRELSVHRVFTKGPFSDLRIKFSIRPDGAGSSLRADFDVEPSGLIGKMIMGAAAKKSLDDVFEAWRGYERYLAGESPSPYPTRYGKALVDDAQLVAALRRLEELPVDKKLVERLGRFVAEEVDERVRDIRPFALADEWAVPRVDLLRLFLWSTRAGLLDLRWHVVCPN
jgi:hypothetical protein